MSSIWKLCGLLISKLAVSFVRFILEKKTRTETFCFLKEHEKCQDPVGKITEKQSVGVYF